MPVIPRRARIWQYAHHSDHLQWQLNLYLQFRDNCKAAGNKQTQNTIYLSASSSNQVYFGHCVKVTVSEFKYFLSKSVFEVNVFCYSQIMSSKLVLLFFL